MKIAEIFSSIQGEGKYTGFPTTFIRVYGCPFKCSYCDTEYAKVDYRKVSLDKVMREVFRRGLKHICITGGEPLLDEDVYPLIYELLSYSYIVTVETSGLVEIDDCGYSRSYSYCMDIKCPCSGMQDKNVYKNLEKLKANDEVKFVVKDEQDLAFAKDVLKKYPTKATIIFSPLNNDLDVCKIIEKFLAKTKMCAKIGIQLHKLLGIK